MNPGSLAAKCGLQEGDIITRISGAPTDHLRHKEAQQRIIDSGNSLELTLERFEFKIFSAFTFTYPGSHLLLHLLIYYIYLS